MKPEIVCIGGGTGQAALLRGLKDHDCSLTAIVTVTDSGRSTGMLRKELRIPAPGDIRNCIISLSGSGELMKDLFQYRFPSGELEGHSFGNLFLAAFTEVSGSFDRAIKELSKILNIKGKVLPSTLKSTHLVAEFEDGTIIEEEANIRSRKSPIKDIRLKDDAAAYDKAVEAVTSADLIVICPGSLYTSVISNFLVKGIRNAVEDSKAKKVYVCNLVTQPGLTDNYTQKKHVEEILRYLGSKIDYCIINNGRPGPDLMMHYEKEGSFFLEPMPDEIEALGVEVIEDDLILKGRKKQEIWQKQDYLRHDPDKIAKMLMDIARK